MKRKKLRLAFLFIVFLIVSLVLSKVAYITNGYTAKYLCSLTFNSGLDPVHGLNAYIKPMHFLFRGVVPEVNVMKKEVTSRYLGFLRPRKAVWREGCGCTLLVDATAAQLHAQHDKLQHLPDSMQQHDELWPLGNMVSRDSLKEDINWSAIDQLLDDAMTETSDDPGMQDNTLALVVAWRGRIIGERYAEGVDGQTPLGGWSATKSITGALAGVMTMQHSLDIHTPVPISEWQKDERKHITIDHLLRMESGLDFEENYASPFADATNMLYASADMGQFAAAHPPLKAPDQRWCYSSGSSNVLSDALFNRLGNEIEALHSLAYPSFFYRLGITSAIFEHDETGSFVGSSYLYMSARDWLRVCHLYMEDGIWQGQRILPEGWVEYSLTPTPNATDACYGVHIWLNAAPDPAHRQMPGVPADAFMFKGFQGQWIVGIPSMDLMLARIGVTHRDEGWNPNELIVKLKKALE